MRRGWLLAAACVALAFCACAAAAEPSRWVPVGLCGGGGLMNPVVSPHDPKTMMIESDMGGRYISRDGGESWTLIHHREVGSSWRASPPTFHPARPGTIYAPCGYGGAALYVSRDDGKSWTPLDQARQPRAGMISRIFVDAARPDRLFLGTDSGKLLVTDDEGGAWREAQGLQGRVFRIVADAASPKEKWAYFVGTAAGVFRSDDDGASFAPKTRGLPEGKPLTCFAAGSRGDLTILYAATPCWLADGKLDGGVYVSADRGESWQRRMNPRINVQTKRSSPWAGGDLPAYSHFLANDANPKRAYVYCAGTSYDPPNHSTLYRTDDAGETWTDVFFADPRFKEFNVALDWMTSYRGQSWVGRPISMDISPTDPDFVLRADDMFVFWTKNAGRSWAAGHAVRATDAAEDKDVAWRNNGLVNTTTWHYYVDPHEPRRHYLAYTDIGFARSLDAGQTWRWWGPGNAEAFPIPRAWINTCYELAFDPQAPGKLWGAFSGHHDIPTENSIWRGTGRSRLPGGFCRSADFGVTWTALRGGLPEAPALSIVLDPKSPPATRTLYAAVYDHGVYKSTDGGDTWALKSRGLGAPENLRVCRVQLHRDGTLFALITGMRIPDGGPFTPQGVGLYRSTDGAESWERITESCLLLYPRDFAVDPADSRAIYLGAADAPGAPAPQGGLHGTFDGGKIWTLLMRRRATHFGAYFHPARPGWVYATGCGWSDAPDGGLWLSRDRGATWAAFADFPFANVNRVDFDPADPSVIYVTTFGASAWRGPAEPRPDTGPR